MVVFVGAVACRLLWVRVPAPGGDIGVNAQAPSTLPLRALLQEQASWCPDGRALRAGVDAPGSRGDNGWSLVAGRWSLVAPDQYAVYVDGVLRQPSSYRIAHDAVQVCLAAGGDHRVLVFGLDNFGRPIEFDSARTGLQAAPL